MQTVDVSKKLKKPGPKDQKKFFYHDFAYSPNELNEDIFKVSISLRIIFFLAKNLQNFEKWAGISNKQLLSGLKDQIDFFNPYSRFVCLLTPKTNLLKTFVKYPTRRTNLMIIFVKTHFERWVVQRWARRLSFH